MRLPHRLPATGLAAAVDAGAGVAPVFPPAGSPLPPPGGPRGVAGVRAPARAGRGRHWAGRDVLPYPVVALGRHFGGVRAAGPGRVARRDTAAGAASGRTATADGRTA